VHDVNVGVFHADLMGEIVRRGHIVSRYFL
jgi:hypothetical protein